MLDFRQLRSLQVLASTGSFTAVAQELGYTQPAVSQQIRSLERTVGASLVIRAGKTVRLTEAGEALARHAGAILSGMTAAEEEVAALAGLRQGRVRLNAFPSGSAALVPAAIVDVTSQHRGIAVSLVESEPPEAVAALRVGDCDIALAFSYTARETELFDGLHVTPLLDDPLFAVVPRSHRLAHLEELQVQQLADERWIAGCPRCRHNLVEVCQGAGFAADIAFATDDNAAAQSFVAHGLGVALMPRLVLASVHHPGIVEIPVRPPVVRQIVALTWDDARRVPAISAMLDALVRNARPARLTPARARP
jgi:DNA-binding transcriptional LysR family regulator